MNSRKSVLLVTDYGIYPQLTQLLQLQDIDLQTEQLMRKAIKSVKRNPPDVLVAEFFHEPQFRDRVSNLESILAQVQRNQQQSATLLLVYRGHESWFKKLQSLYAIDRSLPNNSSADIIWREIKKLLEI